MSRAFQRLILLAALGALVIALGRFAQLRFQTGELYPAYSTLRADPTGSKALYESLRRINEGNAKRNLAPLERLKRGPGVTTVFFGVRELNDHEDFILELVRSGARVVVALDARESRSAKASKRFVKPAPVIAGGTNTNTNVVVRMTSSLLGLEIGPLDLPDTNRIEAVRVKDGIASPEQMFWFGYLRLIPATNEWDVIYTAKDKPVVVERKLGLGSIIVIADSFPFSNEALHLDRQPEFLLWALGSAPVVFDETHLGVKLGSGIAVLMREFRLHGLAIGCLLLVGLWVWRNSVPFVPPSPPQAVVESIEGKTAREAVVHLLRRNLTDIDLLRAGLDEWAKTHPSNEYWQTVRLNEARKLADAYAAAPRTRNLAATQREISKILFPKRN